MSAPGMSLALPADESRSRRVAEGCSFCEALGADGPDREVVVFESEHFVAWVSRGALVEGHLLIVPKRHALNLRQLDPDSQRELQPFLAIAKQRLVDLFGDVCLFEHGPVEPGSPAGCSIDHAHLHLLPWHGSLISAAIRDYPEFGWRPVAGLDDALAEPSVNPYLVVQDSDDQIVVATHPDIPSQALRRTVSAALAREEEWDWKAHPQLETVRRTISRLAPAPV